MGFAIWRGTDKSILYLTSQVNQYMLPKHEPQLVNYVLFVQATCVVLLQVEAEHHGYCDEDQTEGLPTRRSRGDPADGRDRADERWSLHPGHGQGKADPG